MERHWLEEATGEDWKLEGIGLSQTGYPQGDPGWFLTISSWFRVDWTPSLTSFPALTFISLTQPRRVQKD